MPRTVIAALGTCVPDRVVTNDELSRRMDTSDAWIRERTGIEEYAGLGWKYPFLGAAMALFMFSLAGIPPTAGFMGKFWLFSAAIDAGYVWLAVIGVLNSAVSLYYYIRVVVFMWMKEDIAATPIPSMPALESALALALAATILFGIFPAPLFEFAEASARTLGVAAPALTLR